MLTSVQNLAVPNAPTPSLSRLYHHPLRSSHFGRLSRHRCCILKSRAVLAEEKLWRGRAPLWASPVPSSEKPIQVRELSNQPKTKSHSSKVTLLLFWPWEAMNTFFSFSPMKHILFMRVNWLTCYFQGYICSVSVYTLIYLSQISYRSQPEV